MLVTVALLFGAVYFGFSRFARLVYPYDQPIFYPFLVVYEGMGINLALFAFSAFFILTVFLWSLPTHGEGIIRRITIILSLIASLITLIFLPPLGFAFGISLLGFLVLLTRRRQANRSTISLLMLITTAFYCSAASQHIFVSFRHQGQLQHNQSIYNLGLLTTSDFDCEDNYFVVYECDSLGIICTPIYRSQRYDTCLGMVNRALPSRAELLIDEQGVALELDDLHVRVIP